MADPTDSKKRLDKAEQEIIYLKRLVARMEKRLLRQEKIDDMNRHQTQWAMRQLEQARTLAEQANQAKTDFLANMSHEIRTPLNIVLGMGELLAGTALDERQNQYLQSLRLSGEHLLKLINDILDFSRIESGTVEVVRAPMDIRELLVGVEAMGTHLSSEKGLRFILQCDNLLEPRRLGDSRKINQVLLNLVGNAVKFTDSGQITLSVESLEEGSGDWLAFNVSDTGIGIPAKQRKLIFERFSQIEQGSLKSASGVGLGLAISQRLIAAMDGQISITSKVGRGSTFSVKLSLPFAEEPSPPSQTNEERALTDFTFPPLHVLVVDDIYLNFEVVKNYLHNVPATFDYAANGRHAQMTFISHTYDLILMDLRMPVMDGLEAVSHIRKLEKKLNVGPTPVIAMTAHAFIEQEKRYLESGFDAILIKPFSQSDLLRVLNRHVQQSASVDQQKVEGRGPAVRPKDSSEALSHLIPKVLDSMSEEIGNIRAALNEHNHDSLQPICHALKGLAGMYGFTRLADLLEHLEGSARRREFRTAYALVEALGFHVNELRDRRSRQADDLVN